MGILGINHSIRLISQQLRYRGVSLIRDPLVSVMATYRGHVRTRQDAILLFEACQLDVLPKILRRLSRKERKNVISPGAVFVWDEVEAGIQRWTDGRLWGSITLSEEFIVRREMERKARKLSIVQESTAMDVDGEASRRGSDGDVQMEEGTTDDYHYKKNVHWGVPPAQIHQWNDTVMNLYRLLASISQSPTNIPQVAQHDSSHRQTSAVCAASASMVPGLNAPAAPHAQYFQMVQSPPSPPRSPKINHTAFPTSSVDVQQTRTNTPPSSSYHSSPPNNAIEISSLVSTPAAIDARSVSCPPCSSLPMPEDTTDVHHAGLEAHEASFRVVGKLSDTRWEDGRRKEICHQTLKVHRDDERVVRSLDKRFLID